MIQSARLWLLDRRVDLRHGWLAVRRQLSVPRIAIAALLAAAAWRLGADPYLHATRACLAGALT